MPMLISTGNCPSASGGNTSALSLAPSRIGPSTSFSIVILYRGADASLSLRVASCSCKGASQWLAVALNAIRRQDVRLCRRYKGAERTNNGGRMKAAVVTEQGLALREIAQPKPKPNEVLVRVRAAAL